MKLYDELQISQSLRHYNISESEIYKIISFMEPIGLPSDEYIDEVFQPMTELNEFYKDGFINGAKWVKEQILPDDISKYKLESEAILNQNK